MKINRRKFITQTSLFSLVGISPVCANIINSKKNHVVIIGAGWGGLSAAKTLRSLNKQIKITIIEKKDIFISCPISNWVIGQIKTMDDITFSYKYFMKKYNINFLKGIVSNIDIKNNLALINNNKIHYSKLIVSTGVELDYSKIEGWTNNKILFPSAWEAGEETRQLSKRIKHINSNSNFVISIPLSPYRCPPGPYERISLIASYIKSKKLNSKIIVLDANQKIVSKGKLFKKAWDELYSDIIDYRKNSQVVGVNEKNKIISTDFDDIKFDIANIIPPQNAPRLLKESGLIPPNKNWAPVNPFDFSSTLAKNIHVIGDSSDQASIGKIPKSGYIAYSMGMACAYAVHNALQNKNPPSPSMINTCYSLVDKDSAISVSAVYEYVKDKNKIMVVPGAKGLSPNRSSLIADNAWDWAQAIWTDMLL